MAIEVVYVGYWRNEDAMTDLYAESLPPISSCQLQAELVDRQRSMLDLALKNAGVEMDVEVEFREVAPEEERRINRQAA